jgi:hypothetical protein
MMTIFHKKRPKYLKNNMRASQAIKARDTIKILNSKCRLPTMLPSRGLGFNIKWHPSRKAEWVLAASNNKDSLLQMCSLNKLEPRKEMEWAEAR